MIIYGNQGGIDIVPPTIGNSSAYMTHPVRERSKFTGGGARTPIVQNQGDTNLANYTPLSDTTQGRWEFERLMYTKMAFIWANGCVTQRSVPLSTI